MQGFGNCTNFFFCFQASVDNASKPADRDEVIHMNDMNCSRRARHFDFVSPLCCVTVLYSYCGQG
jgi:hypothetical protein